MNRAETEDSSYASARNRKLLAGLGLKPGENEYAEPALNPCQTTAYAFFTGDQNEEWAASSNQQNCFHGRAPLDDSEGVPGIRGPLQAVRRRY